ncbi:hypothetical protein OSB04_008300 [Centaurea solstitialis]|uniref:Uncharacterized protein n=1 Tax=Centaurea solstitialis TaxID=347529 RepID=A0AA38TY71_9ASTR|nr:hypothetical protein OSB04_008300 [Centaurea solstitialis]
MDSRSMNIVENMLIVEHEQELNWIEDIETKLLNVGVSIRPGKTGPNRNRTGNGTGTGTGITYAVRFSVPTIGHFRFRFQTGIGSKYAGTGNDHIGSSSRTGYSEIVLIPKADTPVPVFTPISTITPLISVARS